MKGKLKGKIRKRREGKYHGRCHKTSKTQPTTRETRPVPQMSGTTTDSHSAVQAVGLTMLVRGAGAVATKLRGEKAEGPFPAPGMDGRVQSIASRTSLR